MWWSWYLILVRSSCIGICHSPVYYLLCQSNGDVICDYLIFFFYAENAKSLQPLVLLQICRCPSRNSFLQSFPPIWFCSVGITCITLYLSREWTKMNLFYNDCLTYMPFLCKYLMSSFMHAPCCASSTACFITDSISISSKFTAILLRTIIHLL